MYQKYKYPIALICSQAICALTGTILMRFHHSLFLFAYILAPIVVLEVICEIYKWYYAYWMKFITYFVFSVCFILFWGDPNISRYIGFGMFSIPKALLFVALVVLSRMLHRKQFPFFPKIDEKDGLLESVLQNAEYTLFCFFVPAFVSVFFFNNKGFLLTNIAGLILTLALFALAYYSAVFFAKRTQKKLLTQQEALQ